MIVAPNLCADDLWEIQDRFLRFLLCLPIVIARLVPGCARRKKAPFRRGYETNGRNEWYKSLPWQGIFPLEAKRLRAAEERSIWIFLAQPIGRSNPGSKKHTQRLSVFPEAVRNRMVMLAFPWFNPALRGGCPPSSAPTCKPRSPAVQSP